MAAEVWCVKQLPFVLRVDVVGTTATHVGVRLAAFAMVAPGRLPRAMLGTRSMARIDAKTEEDFEIPPTPKCEPDTVTPLPIRAPHAACMTDTRP